MGFWVFRFACFMGSCLAVCLTNVDCDLLVLTSLLLLFVDWLLIVLCVDFSCCLLIIV